MKYFASIAARQASGVRSSGGVRFAAPAELTRTSIGPSACSTSAAMRRAFAGSIRSAATLTTSPAWPAAFSWRSAATRFTLLRETIATFAPSARNAFAQASPMPLLPPVTSTTLPFNPRSMLSSTLLRLRNPSAATRPSSAYAATMPAKIAAPTQLLWRNALKQPSRVRPRIRV